MRPQEKQDDLGVIANALSAGLRLWLLLSFVVHTQELVCAPELDACHVGAVGAGHSHPVGEDEDWAT